MAFSESSLTGRSSRFTPTILPSLNKSCVPICSDYSIIKPCTIDETDGIFRIFPEIVFNKTEPTWRPLEFIKPHYNPLHLSAFPKQFIYLFFSRIKAHISNV